ncbi:MAG TPA: hypothetical protein VKU00_18025 [Chthonomonadaceae bacterium]|nr:hypothetical protein [Chthonomonadaceae bacterium]
MGQKSISTPLVVAVIALVVLVIGFFLYKGATGGTVGDGHEGRVQAAPPMPGGDAAKQQMIQQHAPNGGGGIRP